MASVARTNFISFSIKIMANGLDLVFEANGLLARKKVAC
jgi:hypothetical protein